MYEREVWVLKMRTKARLAGAKEGLRIDNITGKEYLILQYPDGTIETIENKDDPRRQD